MRAILLGVPLYLHLPILSHWLTKSTTDSRASLALAAQQRHRALGIPSVERDVVLLVPHSVSFVCRSSPPR